MPAGTGDHRNCPIILRGKQSFRLFLHQRFDGAAFFVKLFEFGCDLRRFQRVLRRQQAHAQIRLADAPTGIDARSQRETKVVAQRCASQATGVDEGGQADIAPLCHHLESLSDEGAVQPAKLGNVGNGAQRDYVQQFHQRRFGPAGEPTAGAQHPDQRRAQQKGDAYRRQMAMGGGFVTFIQPVGIDEGKGFGKRGGAFMMVDDDDIDTGLLRHRQRLERLRAAIDGDDQRCSLPRQPHQRFARWAIAFHQPVGDVSARREAKVAQQADEQGGAGRAIHVIIAEDAHMFAALHCVSQPLGGGIHVPEQAGVGHEVPDGWIAMRLHRFARAATCDQQLRHQIISQIARRARIRALPAPAPGLAKDGSGNIERDGHVQSLDRPGRHGKHGAMRNKGNQCPWPSVFPVPRARVGMLKGRREVHGV